MHFPRFIVVTIMLAVALHATAKPIAFADGTTFMHERDTNMVETQIFYAPAYWWSVGAASGYMTSDDKRRRHEVNYAQGNVLVHRWNQEDSQGNLFASFGAGTARGRDFTGSVSAQRYALQGDYETRRIYASFKVDAHHTQKYVDRTDTLQLGWSPYAHDYDELAVWFIAQTRQYHGINNKTESAAFVRLFQGAYWVEIGMNEGRKSQLMFMVNF